MMSLKEIMQAKVPTDEEIAASIAETIVFKGNARESGFGASESFLFMKQKLTDFLYFLVRQGTLGSLHVADVEEHLDRFPEMGSLSPQERSALYEAPVGIVVDSDKLSRATPRPEIGRRIDDAVERFGKSRNMDEAEAKVYVPRKGVLWFKHPMEDGFTAVAELPDSLRLKIIGFEHARKPGTPPDTFRPPNGPIDLGAVEGGKEGKARLKSYVDSNMDELIQTASASTYGRLDEGLPAYPGVGRKEGTFNSLIDMNDKAKAVVEFTNMGHKFKDPIEITLLGIRRLNARGSYTFPNPVKIGIVTKLSTYPSDKAVETAREYLSKHEDELMALLDGERDAGAVNEAFEFRHKYYEPFGESKKPRVAFEVAYTKGRNGSRDSGFVKALGFVDYDESTRVIEFPPGFVKEKDLVFHRFGKDDEYTGMSIPEIFASWTGKNKEKLSSAWKEAFGVGAAKTDCRKIAVPISSNMDAYCEAVETADGLWKATIKGFTQNKGKSWHPLPRGNSIIGTFKKEDLDGKVKHFVRGIEFELRSIAKRELDLDIPELKEDCLGESLDSAFRSKHYEPLAKNAYVVIDVRYEKGKPGNSDSGFMKALGFTDKEGETIVKFPPSFHKGDDLAIHFFGHRDEYSGMAITDIIDAWMKENKEKLLAAWKEASGKKLDESGDGMEGFAGKAGCLSENEEPLRQKLDTVVRAIKKFAGEEFFDNFDVSWKDEFSLFPLTVSGIITISRKNKGAVGSIEISGRIENRVAQEVHLIVRDGSSKQISKTKLEGVKLIEDAYTTAAFKKAVKLLGDPELNEKQTKGEPAGETRKYAVDDGVEMVVGVEGNDTGKARVSLRGFEKDGRFYPYGQGMGTVVDKDKVDEFNRKIVDRDRKVLMDRFKGVFSAGRQANEEIQTTNLTSSGLDAATKGFGMPLFFFSRMPGKEDKKKNP